MINENVIKGQWKMIKGDLQRRWGVLSNDDLDKAKGNVTVLEGLLQKKLGISQEQAHYQLDAFLKKYDVEGEEEEEVMKDNDDFNKTLY